MHLQIRSTLLPWLLVLAAAGTSRAQDTCLDVIDFEAHREGAIVSSVTATGGAGPVGVEGVNPLLGTATNAAIIFDSACSGGCSGGDADLGTPNLDFGGPGSGVGGALGSPNANTIALGNLLIVGEDLIDANRDGLVDDPDDQGDEGVMLQLDFEAVGDVTLHELTVVDVDTNRPPGTVTLLDAGGSRLLTVPLPVTGNNGTAVLDLFSTAGVRRIDIALEQSAAIDNIVFSIPCDDGDSCTVDFCGEAGCVNEPIPGCISCTPGQPCDDADLCTINDTCVEGICAGLPVDCDMVGGSNLPPGTTITTDPQGNGPTPEHPLTTTMTSPLAGDMAIAERSLPSGDLEFELVAPTNTPAAPLVIVSTLDASLGLSLNVQYRKDGVPVPECTGAPGIADPDPCVGDRTLLTDGDIRITIYSSTPGTWTFGPLDSCVDPTTSLPLSDGTACDDGIFCNGADTCLAGSCSDHTGDPCVGGTECAQTCDEAFESCFAPAGTSCTDDGNVCTDNICNGAGSCLAQNNAASCEDGVFCNGADTCVSGDCLIHAGDPCSGQLECADTCNEDLDTCFEPAGTSCSDDGNACSDNLCNGAGICASVNNTDPCDDGIFCNGDDTCMDGSCSAHTGDPCGDGTRCHEQSSMCISTDCSTLNDPACNDGNACTDDSCNVETGTCQNTPNIGPCDDGLFCNGIDACSDGDCSMHGGDPCQGGDECANLCEEVRDTCLVPAGTACTADGNECTDDVCNGAGACTHPANTAPCNDSLFCNGDDTCVNGSCDDHRGDPCTGGGECADRCDEAGQNCLAPSGTICSDDGNGCTDNICDGAGSCIADNNTEPCDDGVACTLNDTCSGGSCQGAPSNDACGNGNACTTDTCDPLDGCQNINNTEPCDNGNPDDNPDQCIEAVCIGTGGCSDNIDCDDMNSCTDDVCLASGSCEYTNNTAPCDDGVACTLDDTCSGGSCQGAPSDAFCDDGDACTTDTCNSVLGCQSTNNTAPCDDGVECTLVDTCSGGSCQGVPSDAFCENGNVCTTDTCNSVLGCQSTNTTAPCEDGLFCNGDDMCMDGSCSAHTGNPCLEEETCDENNDVCVAPACGSGPRLIVPDVTCTLNADCSATVSLDTGGATVASAAATMDSLASLSCGNQCEAESAAPNGICFINPTLCRFAVTNQIGTITPFGDGPLVTIPVICATEGTFALDLTNFSLGNELGGVVPDVCVSPGSITCSSGESNICTGLGDDAPCDDGLFCNGAETCQGGGCAPGTPPCAGDCNETTKECLSPGACVGLSAGAAISCPAGEDCTIPVFIDTGGLELGAVGGAIDAGSGLTCSSCTAGDAAGSASCFINENSCQMQVSALSEPATPFADGRLAEVSVSCAAPTTGEICIGAIDAFGVNGVVERPVCEQVCVPYACTPANRLCSSDGNCDDGIECTVDCCSFDPSTSTLECRHEDNECSNCGDGPRLAGVDTLCTVGTSCNVTIEVESGLDPIASIAGTLDASPGLTVDALSFGACTAGSQTSSLGNPPMFSMAAPIGNAYCDGGAVVAQVRCNEVGVHTLEPTGISLGDDSTPLPLPICGGCGATASVVCVQPGLLIPCGDATLEGKLTSTDSLVVLRHSVGLADPCPRSVCDVDISGDVTANDAMELLVSVVGATTLTCGDTQTIMAPAMLAPTSSTTSTTEESR